MHLQEPPFCLALWFTTVRYYSEPPRQHPSRQQQNIKQRFSQKRCHWKKPVAVDHRGVSNAQLSSEDPDLASKFSNKSIAEQNSVHVAWATLMEERFKSLRQLMFSTESDLLHFRQILVNMVLGESNKRICSAKFQFLPLLVSISTHNYILPMMMSISQNW